MPVQEFLAPLHEMRLTGARWTTTIKAHVRICPGSRPGAVCKYFGIEHLLVAASRAEFQRNLSIEYTMEDELRELSKQTGIEGAERLAA